MVDQVLLIIESMIDDWSSIGSSRIVRDGFVAGKEGRNSNSKGTWLEYLRRWAISGARLREVQCVSLCVFNNGREVPWPHSPYTMMPFGLHSIMKLEHRTRAIRERQPDYRLKADMF